MNDQNNKTVRLFLNSELKFDADDCIYVELKDGSAERFGNPLILNKEYTFHPGVQFGIFSFDGATIIIRGNIKRVFTLRNDNMLNIFKLHKKFELARQIASEQLMNKPCASTDGPRILLAGPTDAGKSTFCRILCNYAARNDRRPIFVDLDIGQGSISVPGTIAAREWELSDDICDEASVNCPFVLNFGSVSMQEKINYYNLLVQHLASVVNQRSRSSCERRSDGIIVNTCGWITGDGYKSLCMAAMKFEINTVIVLDSFELYGSLKNDLPSDISVLCYPKLNGARMRTRPTRINLRQMAIARVFKGTRLRPSLSYTFNLSIKNEKFEDGSLEDGLSNIFIVRVHSVVKSKNENSECSTVIKSIKDELEVSPVCINDMSYVGRLLALMPPDATITDNHFALNQCIGFMVIKQIDFAKQIITVMSTVPRTLESKIAQLTDVTWNCHTI